MQLFRQFRAFSSFGDERIYYLHFVDRAGFESAWVVKNELRITLEYQLVFYIMQSTLCYAKWRWVWKISGVGPLTIPERLRDQAAIDHDRSYLAGFSRSNADLNYLFARWTDDFRIIDWIAHFLQDGRLACICPADDENAKFLASASEVDSLVHVER